MSDLALKTRIPAILPRRLALVRETGARSKTLLITSSGGDQGESIYVQSLQVNGEDWDSAWVTWEDVFAKGGRMAFVLGSEAVRWANGTLPPSPTSY